MKGQDHRSTRRLVEVEIGHEVAEYRDVLTHGRARVRPPVGFRIEPLAAEEDVFDEFDIRVEAQGLVVDVAALGVGADHDGGYAQAVAVLVVARWDDVVVEAAPVVPCQEDGSRLPLGASHDRIDETRYECDPRTDGF